MAKESHRLSIVRNAEGHVYRGEMINKTSEMINKTSQLLSIF